MTAVVITVAFVLVFAVGGVADESIIGRWCDRMIPNMPKYNRTMTIVVADEGRVLLRSEFGDRSSSVNELGKQGAASMRRLKVRRGINTESFPTPGISNCWTRMV